MWCRCLKIHRKITAQPARELNTDAKIAKSCSLNGLKIMLLYSKLTTQARVYLKSATKLAADLQEILGFFRFLWV